MNRIFAVLLALVLMLTLVPATAEEVSYKITDEPVTITLIRSDNSNQPMQLGNDVLKAIEEYTGITLEIQAIAGSDWSTKTEMLVASGADYDIMYDCGYVSNYAGQGAYLDVSKYLDEMPNISALFEKYPDMNKLYIDGALYQIPVMGRYVNRFGRSPQLRQDLLAETGLDTPATYDELYEVLAAIKENHPDMYPIGNRNGTKNIFTCYAYSFGTGFDSANGMYYEPTTGKYQFGPMSDEFATMLQWFANAYADGILDPDYAVTTSTAWQQNMSSGKSCFFYDNPTFASNYNLVLATTDENAKFAPIAVPASENVQRGLYYSMHDMGATVINANTKYPEICCKFMDFLYSDFGCDLSCFGIEGVTFEYVDGVPTIKEDAIAEYMTASDPMRAFFGKYSLAKLGIGRYIDEHDQDPFMTAESMEWYTTWGNWEFMDEPVMNPAFTTAESEEIAALANKIGTALDMEYDAFITGKKDISEWADVQASIAADAERLCEIYNEAAAR